MTDEELLSFNQSGFIPGPDEALESFIRRMESTRGAFLKLGVSAIPSTHWEGVEKKLRDGFDFIPSCLPAFYSNRSLSPWQGAAAWVERGQILAIQLRESFKKGSFLGIYNRSEILAHEAVHAARSAFPLDPWDEYFAYMTSEKAWRRALGPIVQRPWEVWPLLIFCLLGAFLPLFFLGAALWVGLGFYRLISCHLTLQRAGKTLRKLGYSDKKIRYILFRLTNQEIQKLSKGVDIFPIPETSLRSRLLNLYRCKNGTENHC
jgi:hypothetical protein